MKRPFSALLFLFLVFLYLLWPPAVYAEEQFAVDAVVTYRVDDKGSTHVTHDIVIQNLTSAFYATTYTLALENISAGSVKARNSDGSQIKVEESTEGNKLNIKLIFPQAAVGLNAKREFSISYINSNFAVKTGEVWEISIPKLSDNGSFRNYQVNLEVPDSLGQEAYISPQPWNSSNEDGIKKYIFTKNIISESGVTAGFGQFQVFTFNLSYHLENPLSVNSQTEIAIPPDTAFQKVYFSKIEPKPSNVRIDPDGNYLAVYKLKPRQRIDVNAEGYVQIFAGYRTFPTPSDEQLSANLKPTEFWQSGDPKIIELAKTLGTPESIYKYVTETLKYNLERVQPNVSRLGALKAVDNPNMAICMEFTDLFVAISRAAGIPAREVNGYAYTENKELQPLGLVADVLHSWPEYYDHNKKVWIPIDPTWGSTSGIDYFNKLDLRHFTFVIHGSNDREPYPPGSYKLGPNPQKDVFVSFGQLPPTRNSVPQLTITPVRTLPFFEMLYSVNIYNPGPSTLYSLYPTIYFDNTAKDKGFVQLLPPYSEYTTDIKVPYSLLGSNMPDYIRVDVGDVYTSVKVNKYQVIIDSLLLLFAFFIFILLLVLFKLRKDKIDQIIAKIRQNKDEQSKQNFQNTNNPQIRQ